MDSSSHSNYNCYIGIFSVLLGVTFNVLYTHNRITEYEERIADLEHNQTTLQEDNKYLKNRIIRKINEVYTSVKNTDKKINGIEDFILYNSVSYPETEENIE